MAALSLVAGFRHIHLTSLRTEGFTFGNLVARQAVGNLEDREERREREGGGL